MNNEILLGEVYTLVNNKMEQYGRHIRVVDTLSMIEFATQRNNDRHDMYLITMWFVIVMKECKDQLHCIAMSKHSTTRISSMIKHLAMNFLKPYLQRNHGSSRVGILTWNFHSLCFCKAFEEKLWE
jgi:hypothetical protein